METVRDSVGDEYCIFHAPKGAKGLSLETFNHKVFERIGRHKEKVDFSGTVFEGDIKFFGFDRDNPLPEISFYRAAFSGEAYFSCAAFSGKANFSHAAFSGVANFSDAAFSGEADFVRVTFSGEAYFSCAAFSGKAHFLNAAFSGEAYFIGAAFSGKAYFIGAAFSGKAYFSGAAFSGEANFHGAAFSEEANISGAAFSEEAYFIQAEFSGEAYFFHAIFDGPARFTSAGFHGKASFKRSSFNRRADFLETIFYEKADFDMAEFGGKAYFRGETFLGQDGADFTNVAMKDRARFEGTRLKRVSFRDTDLRAVEIVNCAFMKKKPILAYILNRAPIDSGKIEDILHDEDILYDEFSFFGRKKGVWKEPFLSRCCPDVHEFNHFAKKFGNEENEGDRGELKKVELLYRGLKQRCVENHDEKGASDWHYREKEMYKADIPGWRRYPGITFLYWLSSGYGERPFRAGCFLAGLILAASVFMMGFGFEPPGGQRDAGFFTYILNTLQYATFQKETVLNPVSLQAKYYKLMPQIFIPIQAALLALALRNRYRR